MQKILFNDRYGLTQAVIEGRKIMTRRIEGDMQFQLAATAAEDFTYEEATGCIVMCCQGIEIFRHKCRYKVGEVVAVAQNYSNIHLEMMNGDYGDMIYDPFRSSKVYDSAGWYNKMSARADLMPHQIRITAVRAERLQDISDDDCFREGISESWYESTDITSYGYADNLNGTAMGFDTPREAFVSFIDKVSGRGTWERNPWVVVYEFELIRIVL